jgi:hypothetical protein
MFETAIPGAGYGYGAQQVGPQGLYNLSGQFGQPAAPSTAGGMGQPQFGGQPGGLGVGVAQRFAGYPIPQSALPLTMGPGAVPFQPIQPQFGLPQIGPQQFGQPQFGLPQIGPQQFGQPQFGQPQFGQPQFGQPQFGQPQFGQPQFGTQQLGVTQLLQVVPVVTQQGWIGLLLLVTGQPLPIGLAAGGTSAGFGQYTAAGGFGGGYSPLQAQQPIPPGFPQMYSPVAPFGAPAFPGQVPGALPTH